MSKQRELLRQSLIALEDAHLHCERFQDEDARLSVINQIKELLAQPEQEKESVACNAIPYEHSDTVSVFNPVSNNYWDR